MSAQQTRCLVTRAADEFGSRLIPRLLDDGFAVRALARTPDKLATVPWRDRVQVARGGGGDPVSLDRCFHRRRRRLLPGALDGHIRGDFACRGASRRTERRHRRAAVPTCGASSTSAD